MLEERRVLRQGRHRTTRGSRGEGDWQWHDGHLRCADHRRGRIASSNVGSAPIGRLLRLTHGDIESAIVSYDEFADRCARLAGCRRACPGQRDRHPRRQLGRLRGRVLRHRLGRHGHRAAEHAATGRHAGVGADDAASTCSSSTRPTPIAKPPGMPAIGSAATTGTPWPAPNRSTSWTVDRRRCRGPDVHVGLDRATQGVLLTHGGQLFSIDQYLGRRHADGSRRAAADLGADVPQERRHADEDGAGLGGSIVLLKRFDVERRAIDRHRVTAMTGVPTMFSLMFARICWPPSTGRRSGACRSARHR